MFTERVVCSHKILFSLLNKAEWSHLPSPECSLGEREHLFSPGARGDLPEQINRNGCFLIKSALGWGGLRGSRCCAHTLAGSAPWAGRVHLPPVLALPNHPGPTWDLRWALEKEPLAVPSWAPRGQAAYLSPCLGGSWGSGPWAGLLGSARTAGR